jgi:hypothetical protein
MGDTMNAKTKAAEPQVEIRTLKDAGYRVAKTRDGKTEAARFVLDKCPDFLDNPADSVVQDLEAGFMLRHHENKGDKYYLRGTDTGVMVECTPADRGATIINVHVAMSYTGQQFGRLKTDDPALHGVIGPVREAWSKYKSECMADLKGAIRKILNGGKSRERGANKDFANALEDMFDAYDTRAVNSKARGDTTADPVKFRLARDAFMKAYF